MCWATIWRRVHPVHVVGAEDHDVVGLLVVDQVQALEDRVGAAGVPAPAEPLLGRHRGDVLAEHAGQPPGGGDVPVERVRLVLGEHADPVQPGVDQVGQHEVDQPVVAAERHRRLGPVGGERPQPLALAACEHDPEDVGRHRPWRRGCSSRRRSPAARCPADRADRQRRHAGDPSASHRAGPQRTRSMRRTPRARASEPAMPYRARVRIGLLTREYPPDVYGGAGVHVEHLVRALRELVDVDVHCFGEPRDGRGRRVRPPPASALADANAGAADARRRPVDGRRRSSGVDLLHSHTWYANMAGHLAKLLHGVPHVVTAHSLEPRRPWKAEQLGGGYRLSSWAERTAYEARRRGDRGQRRACAATCWTATRRWTRPGCTSSTTASTPTSTSPTRHATPCARHGVDPDRPSVVFVGRITRQKGVGHLVAAAHDIEPRRAARALRRRAGHPGDRRGDREGGRRAAARPGRA